MANTNVTIRMDNELKKQAEELFAALGLNMSSAIGVFCRQAVRLGKIPFELAVDMPNAETLAAIDDVNNNRNMSKAYGKPLAEKYKDHPLRGIYTGHRECHITPDWLLIYKIENDLLTLSLTRTGTHSDLF